MKEKTIYLTQGDAFNLESACGLMLSQTKDEGVRKTFLTLEAKLRQHQSLFTSIKSDTFRKDEK